MLAGKIRLKTFMVGVGSVVGIGGGVAVVLFAGVLDSCGGPTPNPKIVPLTLENAVVTPKPEVKPEVSPKPAVEPAVKLPMVINGRPVDQFLVPFLGRDLKTAKQKDATSGTPYKVNLYQDAGKTAVNRAKIDLDRDEKWDEKWTFGEGTITREVAPKDDEVYTDTYQWSGSEWKAQGAEEPVPEPVAGLRPIDQTAFGYQGRTISSPKMKDVTKGKPYKINVYQDAGEAKVNRLKFDLDRDDKWDEKWTFDNDAVKREVAPNDDEVFSQSFTWSGTAWVNDAGE